jgi:ADP-heptose:LPS heptosyltransferase
VLRRNVLILHAGALGDFLLTWPLIMALARLHPQSRIIVVAQHSKGALAEALLQVEHADVESGWHSIHAEGAAAPEAVTRLVSGAHSIYNFVAASDDVATKNLAVLTGAEGQVIPLIARPPDDFTRHATDFLLDQLKDRQSIQAGVQQMIRSVNTRGISAGRSDGGDVVIHPGSGSVDKCWPADRFVKLIAKLKRKKHSVRVVLGEVEMERMSDKDVKAFEGAAEVKRPANYVDLLNELRTAKHVIANDSGPAHLAGMIGVPTLALFGPTNPAVWKPLGPRVKVLQHQPLGELAVDDVFNAVSGS